MGVRSLTTMGGCLSIALGLVAAPAWAMPDGPALNGTYQAVSKGDWARTDGVYRDQLPVISTWSIESVCENYQSCTGRVTSDQGWTADMYFQTQSWRVRRTIPGWQQCPDGTVSSGDQLFIFYPYTGNEVDIASTTLVGEDITAGVPGACGRGYPVEIRIPFRLTKLS
ncbi:Uncharacterised protein [Mycolicibacterium vanbaalenii]|uniref:Secreted protein n=1 Tax=Mycolicibacterium vanbaalenii TaxID=110539 RepID=A0A5S9RB65_MYCVN|nr:hypothetical protein [Mycolicibacterium vanbaalenii]CAA0136632.1 Uncharacterised protein [Mycolicibacterium vanbaalenii]